MKGNYSYPIHSGWTDQEIATVINFLRAVEDAYEVGIKRTVLLERYKDFKLIVNSKSEEKALDREFQQVSGYSIYRTVKQAQSSDGRTIRMQRRDKRNG